MKIKKPPVLREKSTGGYYLTFDFFYAVSIFRFLKTFIAI
jgi:hypothetical protein